VRQNRVERPWHALQVEGLDEEPRVLDLAGAAPEEAAKLGLGRPPAPLRLFLERSKGAEAPATFQHRLDTRGPKRVNQLALEVRLADEEAEQLHRLTGKARADARLLERAAEALLLARIAEPGETDLRLLHSHSTENLGQRLGSADVDDRDALDVEVVTPPRGERLERDLVAHSLDEHEGGGIGDHVHSGNDAGRMPDVVSSAEWPYRERQPWAPMEADEVVRLAECLTTAGIPLWIDGGWGVDALLEKQIREHDDLDVVIELSDVDRLEAALGAAGYERVAGEAPKSFVLVDVRGRQVDVHPVAFDESRGGGVYVMEDGGEWVYPGAGFSGRGRIGGRDVRCLTPEVQVLVHDGYELGEKDYRELFLLQERFGVEVPAKHAERARAAGARLAR
jgi:lincosamide nucleotidyltransferase A/C/D/E